MDLLFIPIIIVFAIGILGLIPEPKSKRDTKPWYKRISRKGYVIGALLFIGACYQLWEKRNEIRTEGDKREIYRIILAKMSIDEKNRRVESIINSNRELKRDAQFNTLINEVKVLQAKPKPGEPPNPIKEKPSTAGPQALYMSGTISNGKEKFDADNVLAFHISNKIIKPCTKKEVSVIVNATPTRPVDLPKLVNITVLKYSPESIIDTTYFYFKYWNPEKSNNGRKQQRIIYSNIYPSEDATTGGFRKINKKDSIRIASLLQKDHYW